MLAAYILLSAFVTDPTPWFHPPANSEQRQPVYLGATGRELAFGLPAPDAALPERLRAPGEAQLARVRVRLADHREIGRDDAIELETWPARDDDGHLVWTIARWRRSEGSDRPWFWLDSKDLGSVTRKGEDDPFIPQTLRPWLKKEAGEIFTDFLQLGDLYAKPVFGDCAWTNEDGSEVAAAWADLETVGQWKTRAAAPAAVGDRPVCRVIPMPPRMNGTATVLVVEVSRAGVRWPRSTRWLAEPSSAAPAVGATGTVPSWPADFEAKFREDILALDGEAEARFPLSGRVERFVRKSSADPANQLGDVATFLEERYRQLGVRTFRQTFFWRGIEQQNVVAVIPGRDSTKPVLMADHYDTAFDEDVFAKTGARVSAPGADDNGTATVTLLRAAEILPSLALEHDVWLVHLTGEEFPGDDLGARHLVGELLTSRQDITGVVLMDMIGWHKKGDGLFQISAGDSPASLSIARTALDATRALVAPGMTPVLRTRFDEKSYLYNTDGLVFSDAGLPVILINEHVNGLENIDRKGYHQSTDRIDLVDPAFASAIAKVAIETVARLGISR